MFAFAIWDARRHCLFVARDPMGIKPLYYFNSEQYFMFSSEVRSLLGTGLMPRRIDLAGLVSYLTFGSLYDPFTLVEGVRSLAPGHYLVWDGQVTQTRYWDLAREGDGEGDADLGLANPDLTALGSDSCDTTSLRRSERESDVARLLDESVRMQLVSDVPVGLFLSGGIDSSSLVAILSRNGVQPSTFSIVFSEADYSEAEYSRAIAQQFRTDHHEIVVSQSDFFAAIAPAIRAMDLPTIDGINTYFVAERTRAAGVKVALSGLGGDEMFAGYSSFRSIPRLEKLTNMWSRVPGLLRSPLANTFEALASSSDQNRKLAALARNGTSVAHPYFISRMLFMPEQRDKLLHEPSNPLRDTEQPWLENLRRSDSLDPVNRVSYLEARCYMLNTLLRDSDFMSMAHGLEVRVPLIDHRLARALLALPGSWKLDARTPKPLLVKALGGQLPEKIVYRPKRGFTLPFEHWLRDALRSTVEESLRNIEDGPLGSWISGPAARGVWQDFLTGRTSWSRPWSLYVLQRWCEQHLAN
jgi:asparagine synthase (glutamine-hydrolysing)